MEQVLLQQRKLQREPVINKNGYAGPHTAVGWNIFKKIKKQLLASVFY